MATVENGKAKYLLIGGGATSATAATAIRSMDAEGSIVLLAGETRKPYNRPPMSKGVLKGSMEAEDAESKADDFYESHRVDLRTGVRAEEIDRATKTVRLSDGSQIEYENLLLATGASAKLPDFPGAELPGVYTLRTAEDSLRLRSEFEKGPKVVVVGAGYIGIEGAAAATTYGAEVTIVDPSGKAWSKFASDQTSGYLQAMLGEKGVHWRFGEGVEGIAQQGDRLEVTLSGGETLPADLVLLGVGAVLNIEIAKRAGLKIDEKHGVVVDESLRTADPAIWAAGDIAAFTDKAISDAQGEPKKWHCEHFLNARWQGERVGKNMAAAGGFGEAEPYDRVPYFFSDILEAHMILRGDPQGGKLSRTIGDPASGEFIELYAREDGSLAMGMAFSGDESKLDPVADRLEELFRGRASVDAINLSL